MSALYILYFILFIINKIIIVLKQFWYINRYNLDPTRDQTTIQKKVLIIEKKSKQLTRWAWWWLWWGREWLWWGWWWWWWWWWLLLLLLLIILLRRRCIFVVDCLDCLLAFRLKLKTNAIAFFTFSLFLFFSFFLLYF